MKSELENRIMMRVNTISFLRKIRAQVPIKALLLAITLSISTKIISYDVIYGYISDKNLEYQFWYLFQALIHTSIVKLAIIAFVSYLAFSIVKDFIKSLRCRSLALK